MPTKSMQVQAAPENVMGALQSFLEWRRTWGKAVALVWSNPSLEKELIDDPHAFFEKHCGYTVPVTCAIRVTKDEQATYDASKGAWTVGATELVLALPKAPKNTEIHALAINDYVSAGMDNAATFCCC